MSSYKRKRYTTGGTLGYSPGGRLRSGPMLPPRLPKRRAFTPGRDRVGGYYGRYSGKDGERKFHDVDLDDAVVATGGTVTPSINLIAQGVTESERVGRKCTLKSIHWRFSLNLPQVDAAATPAAGDVVRVIMYIDKQCNGATAAVTDVLESADYKSFRNLSNSQRFSFLMDKTFNLNHAGLASDGAGVVSQALNIHSYQMNKVCNLPIEYSSTTGVIGEIRSNNIGVLLISFIGTARFESKIRLRFSDGAR